MTAQEQQILDMMQEAMKSQAESLRILTEQSEKKDKLIESLEARIKELTAQIAWFQRQMFGRKSEKLAALDPNQLSLFGQPEIPEEVQQAQEEATQQIEKETPEDRKIKRQNRKMMEGLPVLERVVLKPEGVDEGYKKIGEEVTRVVKLIPGKLGILEYVREKYAKNNADNTKTDIRIAPLPKLPINKGIADASLLAETILNKYEYHLPLYRQVQQYRHLGFAVNEKTIDSWIKPMAELLKPLYEQLVDEVFACDLVQCDETTEPVINKETHSAKKEYVWMTRAVKERLRCFFYDNGSRAGAVIEKKTKDLHFKGRIQCDGFSGYESAFKNNPDVQLVNCMAHIRRHFEAALSENKDAATYAIGQIQKLYQIERNCTEQGLNAEQRRLKREELARPIMVHLKVWMETEGINYSESSLMGKAVTYAYTRWTNMMRYLEDGEIPIDNNLAENAIRPLTIGRKNYLFCGNHEAAGWMVIFYSLIGTCHEQNINPRLYLNDVIAKMPYINRPMPEGGSIPREELLPLLPHIWSKSHPEALLPTTEK